MFESQPQFQNGIAPPLGTVCRLSTTPCGRAVPDVAMDADPNSGANVYVGGQPEGVGGTSMSSPLALGVWARVSRRGRTLWDTRIPSSTRRTAPRRFHDVTLGDTGPYPATPGYDLATGLGTFDVAAFIRAGG